MASDTEAPILSPDDAQFLASDPAASVWVNASAGTGKTKVLTDRVLRLLLAGNAPERLLCITFTKAAAAEMAHRVQQRLGAWAALSDDRLDDVLFDLTREAVTSAIRQRARQLFGLVVDAPGGLQINTIHAFCTAVLRRFPLEAGLSPQFEVIGDDDSFGLLTRIKAKLFQLDPAQHPLLTAAIRHLAAELGQNRFYGILGSVIQDRRHFHHLFAQQGGVDGAIAHIYAQLGIVARDMTAVRADFCQDADILAAMRVILPILGASKNKTPQKAFDIIARYTAADLVERLAMLDDFIDCFLKKDHSPKVVTAKDCAAAEPVMQKIADRLVRLRTLELAHAAADHSVALLRMAEYVLGAYQALKDQYGWLDYDDLVLRTRALLQDSLSAQWVLYKLDGGIDHILVDEAQDTNQSQWDIITSLSDDFFSGTSARPLAAHIRRTLFVVGDDKQSIYRFQGAEPAAFHQMRGFFATRITQAGHAWREISLDTSFRSVAPVLGLVDALFHRDNPAHDGVVRAGQTGTRHQSHRRGMAGHVELWPLLTAPAADAALPWTIPTGRAVASAASSATDPALMADHIARHIRHLVDNERLESRNRPILPGDFLILVRRRTVLVEHLIRALKKANLPVAGVDRMKVARQLAVQDLLVMAQFVLLPDDDVTFACLLKTPLIGLDDDLLMALVRQKGAGASLWQAFSSYVEHHDALRPVRDWLDRWLKRADFIQPYEFFAQILHQPCPAHPQSGRAAMIQRLGRDILDPVEEFLQQAIDFQIKNPPLLEHFIHYMRDNHRDIKREADQSNNVIRIMTIHGAKGLQAPIVILPDTLVPAQKGAKDLHKIFWPDQPNAAFLWAPRKDSTPPALHERKQRHQQADQQENHRLLYVALTRAEDRLVIAGHYKNSYDEELSWYSYVERALHRLNPALQQDIKIVQTPQTAPVQAPVVNLAQDQMVDDGADWMAVPPPPPPASLNILSPSQAIATDTMPDIAAPSVFSPFAAPVSHDPFRRGILIHRLLQSLPDIDVAHRAARAQQFLEHQAADIAASARQQMVAETLHILEHPVFAPVFGPNSRPEVPITGIIDGQIIAGRLDRLVVLDRRVLVVDFKTNRPPPTDPNKIPPAYRQQMALYAACLRQLYPGYEVEAALLWTAIPLLMPVPEI